MQGYFFGVGDFSFNDTWRYGFNVNLGSTVAYLRDFPGAGLWCRHPEQLVFAEGFGSGSYARLDVRSYQGLDSTINQSLLPYVLPRYEYAFQGQPDALGGRLSVNTQEFDVLRDVGTNDQRLPQRGLEPSVCGISRRPLAGDAGREGGSVSRHQHRRAAELRRRQRSGDRACAGAGRSAAELAVRAGGRQGHQIIEPIVQVIGAPNAGNSVHDKIPNEDALDYEFTDSTLFALNRSAATTVSTAGRGRTMRCTPPGSSQRLEAGRADRAVVAGAY